jgi:drug/metabolite transporter (DMT)-like permease
MLYLIIVSIAWGFSFIIIKGSLGSLDSAFVSFVRLLLSFAVFVPFLRPSGISGLEKLQLMLIGGLQFGLMYLAYISAFHYLPAHAVALLTTTTPIFVAAFSDMGERRFHMASLLAALLAVAGGAVLEFPDQPLVAKVLGIVLIQASNAAFAFGQIAYKRWMASRPALQDKNVFGLMYGGAVLVTGFFWLVAEKNPSPVQPQQWLALLYLGIIASGFGFFLWNKGARNVQEGTLAIMNNFKIPVAVAASLAILGERTGYARLIVGCALMFAALWLNEKLGYAPILKRLN